MNIPKEIQEMFDYLKEFDAERDRIAQAISEANAGNKLGWEYPPDLIVPDDIRNSFINGNPH